MDRLCYLCPLSDLVDLKLTSVDNVSSNSRLHRSLLFVLSVQLSTTHCSALLSAYIYHVDMILHLRKISEVINNQ